MELREFVADALARRKKDAQPKKYGPPKGRPWGRLQRRLYRDENPADPGPVYAEQLHYKNAAARTRYRKGLSAIMATGVQGEHLQYAIEDLQRDCCKRVTIFAGLHRAHRRQLRSEQMREARRYEAERGGGQAPRSPAHNS